MGLLEPDTLDVMAEWDHDDDTDRQRVNPDWPQRTRVFHPSELTPAGLEHRWMVPERLALGPDPDEPRTLAWIDLRGTALGVSAWERSEEDGDQEVLWSWYERGPLTVLVAGVSTNLATGRPQPELLVSGQSLELVDRPWATDDGYETFMQARVWPARAARWPQDFDRACAMLPRATWWRWVRLTELREQAFRLRELHPQALQNCVELCEQQVELARESGDRRIAGQGSAAVYKRWYRALELQGRFTEALNVRDEGMQQAGMRTTDRIRHRIVAKAEGR